jgi:toxin ParE1/3/4
VKPVAYLPGAREDLDRGIAFYEARRIGLGLEFETGIDAAVQSIKMDPPRYSLVGHRGCRRFILSRFPYSVIYQELDDRIRIVAIVHHRQRRNFWNNRIDQS